MANVECPREQDLLDALTAGRWPDRVDAELHTHVRDCAICTDLADVVGALYDARDVVYADVAVPASGTVWWRAQIRARREAAAQAARPVTIVQAPGHTPGHNVLLVRLPNAGPILLTGDMWHMNESRERRLVPAFNVDRAQTLASMDKVEALATQTGARIIRQHVPEDF